MTAVALTGAETFVFDEVLDIEFDAEPGAKVSFERSSPVAVLLDACASFEWRVSGTGAGGVAAINRER